MTLHTLVYSSYLGGGNIDFGWGVAFDPQGRACVAGSTISDDFPLVNAFQTSIVGSSDSFVTKIDDQATGSACRERRRGERTW